MVEIFVHEHVGDGAAVAVAVVVGVIMADDDDTGFAAVLTPFELSSLLWFNVLEFRRIFVELVDCSDVGDATLSSLSAIIPRAIGISPQSLHKSNLVLGERK